MGLFQKKNAVYAHEYIVEFDMVKPGGEHIPAQSAISGVSAVDVAAKFGEQYKNYTKDGAHAGSIKRILMVCEGWRT